MGMTSAYMWVSRGNYEFQNICLRKRPFYNFINFSRFFVYNHFECEQVNQAI